MELAFFGYRLLSRFAEVLPSSAVVPLSSAVGRVALSVASDRRRLVESNLRRVTGQPASTDQVHSAFTSYVRYWLDAFRLPVVPEDRLDDLFSIEGLEHLTAARSHGKGAILALPHMGNWDVAGAWIAKQGIPLTVVVEKLESDRLFTWFTDFRTSLGLNVVLNGPKVGVELLTALRRNDAVALLCDRDVDGTGGTYEFFGEETTLPKGPATLAFRTGAPLLPVAVFENGRGYKAVIQPPLLLERNGSLSADVDAATQALTKRLEKLIRNAPEQWHLFQPNWPSDRAKS